MRRLAIAALFVACASDPADVDPTTSSEASTSATSSSGTSSSSSTSIADESSTGSSDSTSSSTSSSSESTGAPTEPSVAVEVVTDANRAYVEMHGGWGPHLRAPMQDSRGALWFAFDGGPDVNTNAAINYARRGDTGWELVASQPHAAGVQQNAAHVLRNDVVMTYSVNIGAALLEECWLDTADPTAHACNTILIGGPYSTPPSSNYVGAALGPGGETIVWFTVVGNGGGTGQFVYTYDYGGGWNGPIATALPGYNDIGYVKASFRGPSSIDLFGQAYVGAYPNGEYALGVDTVAFGQATTFATLGPVARAGQARTGGDVWIDPRTGDAHVIGRVGNVLGYWFVAVGSQWSDGLEPVAWIDDAIDGRWLHEAGGPLVVILAGTDGVQARWAELGAVIDWTAAPVLDVAFPIEGLDHPSAIYAAGPEYQSAAITGLHFAVCGAYGVADHQIWHGTLTL